MSPPRLESLKENPQNAPVTTRRIIPGQQLNQRRADFQTPLVPCAPSLPGSRQSTSVRRFTPNVNTRQRPQEHSASASVADDAPVTLMLLRQAQMKSAAENLKREQVALAARRTGGSGAQHQNIVAAISRYMPRVKKKTGQSRSLLDLSWPDSSNASASAYRPTTLPFVVREEDNSDEEGIEKAEMLPSRTGGAAKRPTVKHVDEANRSAAPLFTRDQYENSCESAVDMIFVQLPPCLPAVCLESAEGEEKKKEKGPTVGQTYRAARVEELPSGRLGKLVVRKSGRASLVLGGISYNVDLGSDCTFAQEAVCVVGDDWVVLGTPRKKMVVTPDVNALLVGAVAESQPGSALSHWQVKK
eukprot:GHVR01147106.1.p1 GENE.GHVR01147106.1~~GHVR01147106.1.p1  ORF type:complete len:358 (-),score=46.91 GHVR01147106.1:958-2031(-)